MLSSRLPTGILLVAVLAAAAGCRPALLPLLAPSNGDARLAPAEQVTTAFINRFSNGLRDPKITRARERLAHGALVPSRAFGDSAAWTFTASPTTRVFAYVGAYAAGRYRMSAIHGTAATPRLVVPGSTRHVITLTRLADDEFRWDIATDFSLGEAGAANVAAVFPGLFASAERGSEAAIRRDYRLTLPRTTVALGRLFAIDSIRLAPRADGSTLVTLTIGIRPDSLRATYPALASYLGKYLSPGAGRAVLRDRSGTATFFVADARQNRVTLQFRSRDGRLLAINGPARPMPDTLEMESLVSAKLGIFRVGFEHLRSDFIVSRDDGERAWTMHFRRQPEWKLPLFTESLIRSSLRRPFQGDGALFRLSLRDDGDQTLFSRRGHITMEEGTILRFLSRLGSRAYDDLSARVEREIQVFVREVFTAMREDVGGSESRG